MKRFKYLIGLLAVMFLAGTVFAETPSTLKRNVWNAKQTFKHGVQVDGTDTCDINSPIDLTNATITATDKITATHIVNKTDEKDIPLNAFVADNAGTLALLAAYDLNHGAPGILMTDGILAINFASYFVASPILAIVRMPADYVSGLEFRLLISTGAVDARYPATLAWALSYNANGAVFDAASEYQTAVGTLVADHTSIWNKVLSFDLSATAEAAITAGSWVTFYVWNDTGPAGNNTTLEIKGVTYRYTATQ
uniref:Uncharacterized protein n=1 Tax=viral metagenome TaxID=1070528 RepID=A0A6M3IZ22_9ZZZZ